MLTSIRIENFKAFHDTSRIDLPSITLLAGVNSAGKSSLIQALLLLKQTLESGPSQALNPGKGPLLEQSLGDNFNDFVFGRPSLEAARLTYHLAFTYGLQDDGDILDELGALVADVEIEDVANDFLSREVVVTFGWGAFGHRGRPTIRVTDLEIAVSTVQQPLVTLRMQPSKSGGSYKIWSTDKCHPALQDLNYGQLEVDGLSHFLPDSLIISREQLSLFGKDVPPSFARLFRGIFAAVRRDLSEQIRYLNSFRIPPARVYTTGQTVGASLDPNGGNFAQVLWRFRDELVRFAQPDGRLDERPLPDMVAQILGETLQLGQGVRVQPVGERKDILEIQVDTLGAAPVPVTLADVGLGYNQVLPIVVQGLLTPPGALVILEQPEIHLHPKVQARLIDFYFGLARAGRRVLVETHSSHMVDHLCLAMVKDRTNWLAEHTGILFIHPPDEHNLSARIEPVRIDPYGQILNWPSHFLPDTAALYEEILKEGFAKDQQSNNFRSRDSGIVPLRQVFIEDDAHCLLEVLGRLSAFLVDLVYDLHSDLESLTSVGLLR